MLTLPYTIWPVFEAFDVKVCQEGCWTGMFLQRVQMAYAAKRSWQCDWFRTEQRLDGGKVKQVVLPQIS